MTFTNFIRTTVQKQTSSLSSIVKEYDSFSNNVTSFLSTRLRSPQPPTNLVFKSGRVSFSEYEKSMQPSISNLSSDGPSSIGITSYLPSSQDVLSVLSASQEQEFTSLRVQIQQLLLSTRDLFESSASVPILLSQNHSGEKGTSAILTAFENWDTRKDADVSIRDQLLTIATTLLSTRSSLTQLRLRFSLPSPVVTFELRLTQIIQRFERLLEQYSEPFEQMTESALEIEQSIDVPHRVSLKRTVGIASTLRNRFFRFVRAEYVRGQLSSIPAQSSSFAGNARDPGSEKDVITGIASPNARMAVSRVGVLDDDAVSFGPLTEDEFVQFANNIVSYLGTSASTVNATGFLGSYQFGANELIRLGYVKPGTTNLSLKVPSMWTGKDGISSRDSFLSADQRPIFLTECKYLYSRLISMGVLESTDMKAKVKGFVAIASIQTLSAANQQNQGISFQSAGGRTNASIFSQFADGPVETSNRVESEANQSAASSNYMADSMPFSMPSSTASPVYPHNHVEHSESGHYREVDDTPGSERIAERHRTGTGYEIDENGTQRNVIRKDRYTLVCGDDFIIVNGNVNIYVEGDAGVVANNVNINTKEDLNITCGSSLNIKAADMNIEIEGQKVETIGADSALSVGGFMTAAIEGNLQFDSKAFAAVARSGTLNLEASESIGLRSDDAINAVATSDISIFSAASTTVGSSGNVSIAGGGNVGISGSGSATLFGSSGTFVSSDGNVSIAGSGPIRLSHPVEKALYADTAGLATLGTPVPISPSGSSSDGGISATLQTTDESTQNLGELVSLYTLSSFDSSEASSKG